MDHKGLRATLRFAIAIISLAFVGCASKRGAYVSGVYDPDLDLRKDLEDQCVALNQSNVETLKRMNLTGKRWAYYCKSCNDKQPQGPYKFGAITYSKQTKMTWFFGPDSNSVYHAARMYVEIEPNRFYSLAKLINCPTKATSTELFLQ